MLRRDFLRSSLILSGGLLVGDAALEAFERLTHTRKSFPSAAIPSENLFAGSTWMVTGYTYEYWVSDGRGWRRVEYREPVADDSLLTHQLIGCVARIEVS